MKKILTIALLCTLFNNLKAQNTPWSTSGPIGIGTTSPSAPLQIQTSGGTGATQLGPWVSNPSAGAIYLNGDFTNSNNYNFLSAPTSSLYINRPSGYGMLFREGNGTDQMVIAPGGNIGIGTNTPGYRLDVNSYIPHGEFIGLNISNLYGGGDGSTTLAFDAGNAKIVSSQVLPGSNARNLDFLTNDGTATKQAMRIMATGNVGIGTSDTHGYKFAVNGDIHTKKVVVDLINWPDYVFKPTYNLKPLSEVKTYIDLNHHLPDMPSGKEVAEKGVDLGEMNKLLTKKVEELTLYLIEKEKKEKLQEERITRLETLVLKSTNP
jgi:hypothetical protein